MVGTTAGPPYNVSRIGRHRAEGQIPEGWFDDPYHAAGALWRAHNAFVKLEDGRGWYPAATVQWVNEGALAPTDLLLTDFWGPGLEYEEGNRVITSESRNVGNNVILEVYQEWVCTHTHTVPSNENNGPILNRFGWWNPTRTQNISFASAPPEVPPEVDETIGITIRTTIPMDKHEPPITTEPGRPNEPGEYKFGDKSKGVWESYTDMESIITRTQIVVLNLKDRNNRDNLLFFNSLERATGHKVVWRFYNGQSWIRWNIQDCFISRNRKRANVLVESPAEAHSFAGGDRDVATTRTVQLDFLFDLARPNEHALNN